VSPADYDRLEFLGDAVVGMLLAEIAYRRDPNASSGDLTRRRAHLARRSTLAAAAERMDLGSFVMISEGEARQGGTKRRRLLADLFEAVVGAVYLDGGLEAARGC
jgi:ribonuclease-3